MRPLFAQVSDAPKRPKRTEPAGSRNWFRNGVNTLYRSQDLLLRWFFAWIIMMTSKRILIADDSNTARGGLAKFFAQRDFDVCEAVDGEDTIEKARKLKPDLILLDVAMPHTNGIAAASVLKEMLPNVRIVLFTMYTEAIARAFPPGELAADAVISKGDGMGKLEQCVQSLLRS
jgi:CheY-like chemotaxis protein